MRRFLLVSGVCLTLVSCGQRSSSTAEAANFEAVNSIGRWCAKPSTVKQTWQLIEIIRGSVPVARVQYGDGSSRERKLTETQPGSFAVAEDNRETTYRLNETDRDIGLYDDQGLVFFAKRMEATEGPQACLGG